MNAHDDYWWNIDKSLFYADAYVHFVKMLEKHVRKGFIIPTACSAAAECAEELTDRMKTMSTKDRIIIRKLIEEVMR
jgi:hypothetical protein